MEVSQIERCIRENPSINGFFGGTPIYGNQHICRSRMIPIKEFYFTKKVADRSWFQVFSELCRL